MSFHTSFLLFNIEDSVSGYYLGTKSFAEFSARKQQALFSYTNINCGDAY